MANCIVKLPNVGDTIYYKLRSSDRPVKPDRKWKGKVIQASPETSRSIACVKVELLDKGYEGMTELVMLSQIIPQGR